MVQSVDKASVQCGVIYRRTGCAPIETYKQVFESGEIGNLALFKEDWLHHYPQWNAWATDPERNGGPFMDAMIHNMNIARYLMGRPATSVAYFSDDYAHPDIKCNDTEFMKLNFNGGAAHLFITWAADLEVFSKEGNDREHIDIIYMITDKGWRLTEGEGPKGFTITASRQGETKQWVAESLPETPFDGFARVISDKGKWPRDLPTIREAYEDIKIMRDAEANLGRTVDVDLSL
jgi:predicted dehydrogenase